MPSSLAKSLHLEAALYILHGNGGGRGIKHDYFFIFMGIMRRMVGTWKNICTVVASIQNFLFIYKDCILYVSVVVGVALDEIEVVRSVRGNYTATGNPRSSCF